MTRLARAIVVAVCVLVLVPSAAHADAQFSVSDTVADTYRTLFHAQPPKEGSAARLRRPRGTYTGRRGTLELVVSGRSIDIAAFDYDCGDATGRTSLTDIPVVRRRGRYRFSIRAHGITTYSDDHPDENAVIRLSGRFTPKAVKAIGVFRVKTPHCGGTGPVEFTARR